MKSIRLLAPMLCAALFATASFATPSNAITQCDRLAAHPEDPDHVGVGIPSKQVDLPKAAAACALELKKQPDNGRIRYQYARALAYSGDWEGAAPEMKKAADSGYRQAQFVYGLFVDRKRLANVRDVCIAEKYWLKAAQAGRQHARVQYAHHHLNGKFSTCQTRASQAELAQLLNAAASDASDFYERMLIGDLQQQLAAQSTK